MELLESQIVLIKGTLSRNAHGSEERLALQGPEVEHDFELLSPGRVLRVHA